MKGKRGLIRLAALTIGGLALIFAVSQLKYARQIALYRENRDAFEAAAEQLKTLMAEIKREEPVSADHEEYVEVWLLKDGDTVTLSSLGQREGGGYGVVKNRRLLSDFPELNATLLPLREVGLSSVHVYDFSHTAAWEGKSPCEIWFGVDGGSLVWSESGALTHPWDVTNPGGPGYRFYQKKINSNWFAAVSRYDKDSMYWRT